MTKSRRPAHWLMKTEPETFSIDDLARVKVEPWTGVRNYQARNLMRDQMQVGDRVLFYHSNAEPSGVAGLATIHRTGVVDETQFDPASPYHDPASRRDEPRWICVDVAFEHKLPRLIPLAELREVPALADMVLLRKGSRLSVQPVTPAEYALIVKLATKPAPAASRASRTTARR
jgi:predicted RNA-binding protein with PUA-like domain